jgi:hypothetical protein
MRMANRHIACLVSDAYSLNYNVQSGVATWRLNLERVKDVLTNVFKEYKSSK